ncbi:hypothetical protein AG1IA_00663 [Rhizoctonia solani AG-1 IA]|uniref:Uncharacterized protein n=1 Tax=Thanatephorus cucumeris (strain AG1-IA) TaxID=983506 RepID=L8X8C1_THACA|nr:hypothetical protein AG1IA_00663 [Rhizoctonia solani AG-1 IA]
MRIQKLYIWYFCPNESNRFSDSSTAYTATNMWNRNKIASTRHQLHIYQRNQPWISEK